MALGRVEAYSLNLATLALCQTLGAISGESGPPEQGSWAVLSPLLSPVTSLTLLLPTEAWLLPVGHIGTGCLIPAKCILLQPLLQDQPVPEAPGAKPMGFQILLLHALT